MRVLPDLLLRAPLLPAIALDDPSRSLERARLGRAAIRVASRTLLEHADPRAEGAWRRYGRRAAFRATPHGLLAGVIMARAEDGASRVALGDPEAYVAVRFARLAAMGRALLASDAGWREAKLRLAPSLLRDREQVTWLAFGEGAEARCLHAEIDSALELVLESSAKWVPARTLARRLATTLGGPDEARTFLYELIDDGLLHHDLEPPLVGDAPGAWASTRFRDLGVPASAVEPFVAAAETETRIAALVDALAQTPGHRPDDPFLATLVHRASAAPVITRAALQRAAECAPLLFALADALHPPLAEAELSPGLELACEAASALVGEGLLPVPHLHFGRYGVRVDGEHATTPRVSTPALVAWLTGAVIEAARAQREELVIDDHERLRALLPQSVMPATFELLVQPCTPPAGGTEGDDWLLGLHGPAGASWGRFHAALGEPMQKALARLSAAEHELDDEAIRVDVAYSPSYELADLCQAPAVRDAVLAINSWPDEGVVLPRDCAIANEPAGPAHRGIAIEGHAVVVAPLHRVRSTTAAPSVYQSLLGDTLLRQHAPWAFVWGPLREAPWLPRVRLHGFVVAPQSWALPAQLSDEALRAWREAQRVPRVVQVGSEDVLLPIDLDDARDRESLRELPAAERRRAIEIWPPLGRELDEGGRRVEVVAAVIDDSEAWRRRNQRLAALTIARAPSEGAAAAGWKTVKLYAAPDALERVLVRHVAPFLRQRSITAWFFLPYAESAGVRDQVRLRLQARDDAQVDRLVARLSAVLARAIGDGDLVAYEVGAYRPEHARYREALPAVEKIFQSDSRLVLDLLTSPEDVTAECALVASFHALALGLGCSHDAMEALARAAFATYEVAELTIREELAPAYRMLQRTLLESLASPREPYAAHTKRVKQARMSRRASEALLPTLLHLASVRMCGVEREKELRALYLWGRALESLRAQRKRKR